VIGRAGSSRRAPSPSFIAPEQPESVRSARRNRDLLAAGGRAAGGTIRDDEAASW